MGDTAEARWPLVLCGAILTILLIAGGASRADVLGQSIVRLASWSAIVICLLSLPRDFRWRRGPVFWLLMLCIALPLVQLIPLPPAVWTALPGRTLLEAATDAAGLPLPWRPISISPGATFNSLSALVIPFALYLVISILHQRQHWSLLSMLIAMMCVSAVVAVLQVSGGTFRNPLINVVPGSVSGTFANRNHFALFIAIGCVLLPVWATGTKTRRPWKLPVALAALPILLMVSLASGSRSGAILTALGIGMGLWIARHGVATAAARFDRKTLILLGLACLAALIAAVAASVSFDRAASIERAMSLQSGEDLRGRALPWVLELVKSYFPLGAGFGTFDPAYRIIEPDQLLQNAYFNHAHNDIVEVAFEGGVLAIGVLLAVMAWAARASYRTWRIPDASPEQLLARAGSCVLLLVVLASALDYPARTPLVMAVCVIAALWLERAERSGRKGSPQRSQRAARA